MKKVIKYILLFVLFFSCIQFFYGSFRGDYVYNYGFSYAISRGEIPYNDFNMIIPPFGAFLYAIPLMIFGTSNIVFNITQAILLCVVFYYLFKLLDKKAYIIMAIICMFFPIPFCTILFPGYNFLLLLELIILIYLEKNDGNDYLIGLLLAFSILTKQTVGFCLVLVSLYYLFKNRKKFMRRLVGFIIPCVIFLIYLLITKSLYNFLDLCLFGMFDFTNSNGKIMDYNFILFLIGIIYLIYRIVKDKSNIINYYFLAFSMVAIPLFDYYHVSIFLFSILILIIYNLNIKYSSKILFFNSLLISISAIIIWNCFYYKFSPHFTNYNGFNYFTMNKKIDEETKVINNYIAKNKKKNLIILGANAYFFKMTNNLDINYYDLLNYGNHGYDGTNKVINMIKKEKNPVFIININEYKDNKSDRQQINKKVMKYVFDNYVEDERIGEYIILKEK